MNNIILDFKDAIDDLDGVFTHRFETVHMGITYLYISGQMDQHHIEFFKNTIKGILKNHANKGVYYSLESQKTQVTVHGTQLTFQLNKSIGASQPSNKKRIELIKATLMLVVAIILYLLNKHLFHYF